MADAAAGSEFKITGVLNNRSSSITGTLSGTKGLEGSLNKNYTAGIYNGDYTVVPDFEGTVLNTRGKVMRNDVTVDPILVSRTTNLSGGTTVYIGGVIENA